MGQDLREEDRDAVEDQEDIGDKLGKSYLDPAADAIEQEGDSVAFVASPAKEDLRFYSPERDPEEEEIDEITKAYRAEVTAKYLDRINTSGRLGGLEVPYPDEYTSFFKDLDNKRLFAEAKNVLKDEVEKIAFSGYSTVNSRFKDKFQPINWEGAGQQTKKSTIRDSSGNEVVTVTQTTNKPVPPLEIKKKDGSGVVEVKNYRIVDVPHKVNPTEDNDFVILRWSLRDAEGKDLGTQDGQVCLTAHYNKRGELIDIFPEHIVQFTDRDDNSLAYIEQEGKIYTLPVNRGAYKALLREKNRGKGRDLGLSQEIEADTDKAVDSFVIGDERENIEFRDRARQDSTSRSVELEQELQDGSVNIHQDSRVPEYEWIKKYTADIKEKIEGSKEIINDIKHLSIDEEKKKGLLFGIMNELKDEEKKAFAKELKNSSLPLQTIEAIEEAFPQSFLPKNREERIAKSSAEAELLQGVSDSVRKAEEEGYQVASNLQTRQGAEKDEGKNLVWKDPVFIRQEETEAEKELVRETIASLRGVVESSSKASSIVL